MKFFAPILILLLIGSGIGPCKEVLLSALTEVQPAAEAHCSGVEEEHACCKSTPEHTESGEEAPDSPCEDNCDCYCCAHPVLLLTDLSSHKYTSLSISETIQDPANPPVRDFSYLIWRPPQRG